MPINSPMIQRPVSGHPSHINRPKMLLMTPLSTAQPQCSKRIEAALTIRKIPPTRKKTAIRRVKFTALAAGWIIIINPTTVYKRPASSEIKNPLHCLTLGVRPIWTTPTTNRREPKKIIEPNVTKVDDPMAKKPKMMKAMPNPKNHAQRLRRSGNELKFFVNTLGSVGKFITKKTPKLNFNSSYINNQFVLQTRNRFTRTTRLLKLSS